MRHGALIPDVSMSVLSSDNVTLPRDLPSPVHDPETRINHKQDENATTQARYIPLPQSAFNTMRSMFDVVQTLWWPSEIPWRVQHPEGDREPNPNGVWLAGSRSHIAQQYAREPKGDMTPIWQRRNIRQPQGLTQGGLQTLSDGEV